ncbi:MAG: UTP--glucose-1-phosphate uridylyltransferase, partial [Planctomycetaceae bacterium]
DLSTKVVAKRSAEEKMGVLVELDGRTEIIEYSDMPADIAAQTDTTGRLLLWAGNTAIHVFSRALLERLVADAAGLPFHVAHKAVPHIDATGRAVEPTEPNALKFEKFIFDALPLARRALVMEVDRRREFNPVKNREGNDSPDTARSAMMELFREWLREAGVMLSDEAAVEISPLSPVYRLDHSFSA